MNNRQDGGRKLRRYSTKRSQHRLAFAFMLPWVIGFLVFSLYPILCTLYYSFTDYNLFQDPVWVGLKNFASMFSDEKFYKSLYNSLYFVIVAVPLELAVSLATAIMLNWDMKGKGLFRTLYYLPSLVPPVAAALVWVWMLNPQYGLVNGLLRMLSLPEPLWLLSALWSKPAIILITLWSIGSTMIVYLAGIGDIPKEYYEAIAIDGGGAWKRFRHITWPLLTPVTLFQLINAVIFGFNTFTQSYIVMLSTGERGNAALGGVENSLLFYAVNIYQEGFKYLKFGYASALAWMMLIIVLIITAIIFGTSKKWVHYEGD